MDPAPLPGLARLGDGAHFQAPQAYHVTGRAVDGVSQKTQHPHKRAHVDTEPARVRMPATPSYVDSRVPTCGTTTIGFTLSSGRFYQKCTLAKSILSMLCSHPSDCQGKMTTLQGNVSTLSNLTLANSLAKSKCYINDASKRGSRKCPEPRVWFRCD